jgi:dTDP-glucose 4,6-dehydratase
MITSMACSPPRRVGATYLFGGGAERRNIDVVRAICALLDELVPDERGSYSRLIKFVPDRPRS